MADGRNGYGVIKEHIIAPNFITIFFNRMYFVSVYIIINEVINMVYGIGVNDMPRGWKRKTKNNLRIYSCWNDMLRRCYSVNFQEKNPSYIGCTVCERWLTLSNFVEDISKIDNYDLWLNNPNQKIALDKDIKSNGNNKCYCLEQCKFTTQRENTKQANKNRDYSYLQDNQYSREKSKYIERWDKDGNLIDIKYRFEYEEMGFDSSSISKCCNNKLKTHKGFIWKYHKGLD